MAKAIRRAAETWRYILESDRALDPSQQSVFVLKPLIVSERLRARDGLTRTQLDGEGRRLVVTRTNEVRLELVLSHIESIENFPAGAPQPWPATLEQRAKYIEQLDDAFVQELGDEIYGHSTLDVSVPQKIGDDFSAGSPAGNSSPPEPMSSSGGSSQTAASTTVPPASGIRG